MKKNSQKTKIDWTVSLLPGVIALGLMGFGKMNITPTDGRIEGALERRLDMDSRIKEKNLGVQLENGQVRLFGMVETL